MATQRKYLLHSFGLNKKKFKLLKLKKKTFAGRNNLGSITVRHKGGGNVKSYLIIDKSRILTKKLGVVVALARDIHKSCFLALVKYSNGMFSYILAPSGMYQGSIVKTFLRPLRFSLKLKVGYQTIIGYLYMGNFIFDVEVRVGETGKYAKAAGTFCKISYIDHEKRLA